MACPEEWANGRRRRPLVKADLSAPESPPHARGPPSVLCRFEHPLGAFETPLRRSPRRLPGKVARVAATRLLRGRSPERERRGCIGVRLARG